MFRHALSRSLILILLGVFLRSMHSTQTNWTFEDTLTQIGLGYPFLFLLARYSPRMQAQVCGFLLVGYWMLFAIYPLPAPGFDYTSVGVPPDWPHHLSGFAAHWDKNTNFAARFDQWFLNLFPRPKPFVYNGGGYLTLSFIPTLATMILGLLAGGMLRSGIRAKSKVRNLIVAGVALLVIGWSMQLTGLCPVVKRIWTPSWTIFSGGWCCLLMAAFYYVIDMRGRTGWAFPLIVVGMNSIAMYVIAHIFYKLIRDSYKIHLGSGIFDHAGIYAPIAESAAVLFGMWLIVWWMWRRRWFVRV